MTDHALSIASERLLISTVEFVKAAVDDGNAEDVFLARLMQARQIAVVVNVMPSPCISVSGADDHGLFAKDFPLQSSGLN